MPGTEADLLEAASSGDRSALRTLLEQHGPQIGGEIEAQIGQRWQSLLDADDVMQVTYLEAFLQIAQLTARDVGGFLGWLRRIAQNNLRDAIKELSRQKRPDARNRVVAPPGEDSYVALVNLLGQTSTTPSRHAAQGEAGRIVNQMIDRLPPDYGSVVRLYDLDGRTIHEVAQQMGRSPGAVHMMRVRAHDRLRSLLGSESDFFSSPA
jgi:RNA polymerase sigma-70 factor (ECF subfamily)